MKKLNAVLVLAFAVVLAGCGNTNMTDETTTTSGDVVDTMVEVTTGEVVMPTEETTTSGDMATAEEAMTAEEATTEIVEMVEDAVEETTTTN